MFSIRLCLRGVVATMLFLVVAEVSPTQQLVSTKLPTHAGVGTLIAPRGCRTLEIDLPAPPYALTADEDPSGCRTRFPQPDSSPLQPCGFSPGASPHCADKIDTGLRPDFDALGKKKRPILGARAKVLDILETGGACAEWFQTRSPNPAAAFRTLSFAVDSKAVDYIIKREENLSATVLVNPYVANVTQDGGEFQTITLNAGGAFFHSSTTMIKQAKEGGPSQLLGARTLKVGPYIGNTLEAQVTTLLHELGHLEGLLPLDTDDANGQSAANTREVLRHCQSEVETSGKRAALSPLR